MDEQFQISMPLLLDEGFLRRECPHCERQFKVRVEQPEDSAEAEEEDVEYFCPLCHEPARANAWWTQEQLKLGNQLLKASVSDQLHDMLGRTFGTHNRPGAPLQMELQRGEVEEPTSFEEMHNMTRVDPPCHEETPLKIPDDWTADVACFKCGVRYPVELILATE